jgi:phosphatidylserine decarboxylase
MPETGRNATIDVEMVVYGIYYALALTAAAAIVTYLASWPFAAPFYILAAFCLYFFRDPERAIPPGAVAVSPADGKVVAVKRQESGGNRVSIFLNVFDVHVNRAPISGKVSCIQYRKGRFLVASKEEASHSNEQNTITIDGIVNGEGGGQPARVVFKQIAGLIARRIVCYKKAGDLVEAGERVGLIKFGSRVDVFLGPEWKVTVRTGEHVAGGSSILARLGAQSGDA